MVSWPCLGTEGQTRCPDKVSSSLPRILWMFFDSNRVKGFAYKTFSETKLLDV